ncbi:Flavoredoxin [subsurface metagenome]
MSSDPPVIAISLKKSRYSLKLIRDSNEFTVNIPPAELFKETDYCGIVSGRKRNKFNDTNFTPLKSTKIDTPIIKECPFNMECKVQNEVEVGEYVVLFGEIVETHIDEDKINKPNMKIDISKVNPLVYCATVREYWELGKKLGKGFHAGKELLIP